MISFSKLRVLLILIIFLSVFSVGFYFVKNFSTKGVEIKLKDKDINIAADLELKQIHVIEKKKSKKEWELEADLTEIFNTEQTTLLKHVKLKFFPENRKVVTVVANEGKFNNETKNMEVSGDVVVSSEEGYSLKTNSLKWTSSKKIIETDDPVEISKEGLNIKGKGLFSALDENRLEIKNNVKAVFYNLN